MRAVLVGVVVIATALGAVAQPHDELPSQDQPAEEGRSAPRIRTFRFSDVLQARPIPKSHGASFCALTMVDDDTPQGFCRVFYDRGQHEWMHQTGGRSADNGCEVTCLWLSGNGSNDDRSRTGSDQEFDHGSTALDRVNPSDSEPTCRPPRLYRYVLREPKQISCTPNRVPVFTAKPPDTGNALARATLIFANGIGANSKTSKAGHYWNAGVQVGSGTPVLVGDDLCPDARSKPKPVLGFGHLDQAATVTVTATSGAKNCVDGSVTVLPGSALDVWVEDPARACQGRDLGFSSSLEIPLFQTEEGWRWGRKARSMLRLSVPPGSPTRRTFTVLAALEASVHKDPNRTCGRTGAAGVTALLVSAGRVLASRSAAFSASQGMGHVAFGINAHTDRTVEAPRQVELLGRTNVRASAGVFTGGCCGQVMMGFIRQ